MISVSSLTAGQRLGIRKGRTSWVPEAPSAPRITPRLEAGECTHWLKCRDCKLEHPFFAPTPRHLRREVSDWRQKHQGHQLYIEWTRQFQKAADPYGQNANIKEAFQAVQTMVVTNYVSLGNSATAGWGSAYVDNSSDLYLDALVMAVFPAVNTAPANNKAVYFFAFGGNDTTDFTTNGAAANAGTQGTMTYPNVTSSPIVMPRIGVAPYTTQNVAFKYGPFTVAKAFGGILPNYWGLGAINYTGMTLSATCTLKYSGSYNTAS